MNFLESYFSVDQNQQICVSAEQGSNFAKQIADDFNPIHNADSRRFCVPGDLLFAIALKKYGLYADTTIRYLDLVAADTPLNYPSVAEGLSDGVMEVANNKGKQVLAMDFAGAHTTQDAQIEQLVRNYVVFSGQNFPHILVPLMLQHNVMINPARPLVIYQSMSLHFDTLDFSELDIQLADTTMEVLGKRGNAQLHFSLNSEGKKIGRGIKNLVLSGLREYHQPAITAMCDEYNESKQIWLAP